MSIAEQVAEYVRHRPYGSIFTHKQLVNHLGGHGSRISQSLNELEKAKVVLPIERGLWQRPKQTRFGIVLASPEKVVSILERERKVFAVPSGAKVLNELGASTQLPMKPIFISNKRIQPITLGKTVIQFNYSRSFASAVEGLAGLSIGEKKLAAKLWVALEYAGESHAAREKQAFVRAFSELTPKGQAKLLATFSGKLKWAKQVLE